MAKMILIHALKILYVIQSASADSIKIQDEKTALEFVVDHDETYKILWNVFYKSAWEYYTNITTENEEKMNRISKNLAGFDKEATRFAQMFEIQKFRNTTLRRQLTQIIERSGPYATNDSELVQKLKRSQSDIQQTYREAYFCLPRMNCLHQEGLEQIMRNSRDSEELMTVWEGWRHVTGSDIRKQFTNLTTYLNKAVQYNGHTDVADWWGKQYEMAYFRNEIARLFRELQPLYQEIHAYVRKRLLMLHGRDLFSRSGHIPAHLLGSLEGGNIHRIYNLLEPYPKAPKVNITKIMIEQNFNISLLYRLAEDFYVSLGLDPLTEEFWERSMFVRPTDRQVLCQPSAWDFGDGEDYRIKACTNIDEDDLEMTHREVGHIVYYQSYKKQPAIFRNGANPAFHDAFANLAALSINTQDHHQKIGFIGPTPEDREQDINYLLKLALEKVAVLPYAFAVDHWRWNVFRGLILPSDYNKEWWNNRCRYEGVSPPVARSSGDFDPAAHFYVTGSIPLIRHFISVILQFQWHEALCKTSGHQGDLHRCNIYGSKAAGKALRKALSLGSSQPWQNVMKILTGQRKLSMTPLLRYFKPLFLWLKDQNKEENIGWARSCPSIIPHLDIPSPMNHPHKYLRYFYVVPSME
ncbi:angiotensin-converting enzyme [Magallana gigas]|uniref:angiotensin-converting enzyme n=1 Tax=Magallana gigas TaxID=29159 RepID=UPI0033424AAC